MKKKKNSYQFRNIIKEKIFNKYNQREKERFLIDKKIYIPRKNELNNPFWLYDYDYSNDYEISDGFFEFTDMNILFIKEILKYCESYSGFMPGYSTYEKRMKRIINMTLDDIDKEKIIREEYDEYLGILDANYLTEEYFDKSLKEHDMFGCVTIHGIDETTVIKFITNKHPYLGDDSPISDCRQIKKCVKILKFLKEEMNKITDSKEEKVYKPKPTTPLPFNDEIFRTIEAQNWFYETLKKMGAIETGNTPKKRKFQPICHAIFYSPDCKKKIFRYSLELKDFILFLNKEFNTNIKTKLSNGYLHEAAVEELLLNLI